MKIYFTASTTNDGQFQKQYKKIVSLVKKNKNTLLSGEQIVKSELLNKDKLLSTQAIFQREKSLIDASDCVIAEVSQPSLGVGGEIVYALIRGKPVLVLAFEHTKDTISPMIAGNPSENLFKEYYNFDKLPYILSDFLSHIQNAKKRRGKLIVIEGGNGAGKTTQSNFLIECLKKQNIPAKYVHFPQYYNSFHGKTVTRFLSGEFGNINKVSPYLSSLAYAVDRASIKKEMEDFLKKGGYIIADRYVSASMAHQGAKFTKQKERKEFLKWLYELEYKVNKVPKENIVLYLYVPWKVSLKLTQKKTYDIEEKDKKNRIGAEDLYMAFFKKYKHWVKIDCVEKDKILPPESIHQRIVNLLKQKKLLP